MHACIHTYIKTYIHTYMHTYIHTYRCAALTATGSFDSHARDGKALLANRGSHVHTHVMSRIHIYKSMDACIRTYAHYILTHTCIHIWSCAAANPDILHECDFTMHDEYGVNTTSVCECIMHAECMHTHIMTAYKYPIHTSA